MLGRGGLGRAGGVWLLASLGCGAPAAPAPAPVTTIDELPVGAEQLARVCAYLERESIDSVVRAKFCGAEAQEITSLRDLERVLDLGCPDVAATVPPVYDPFQPFPDGFQFPPGFMDPFAKCGLFALSTLSSSLAMKQVSPLNPRAFIFGTEPRPQYGYRIMAFTRGDHLVELITENRNVVIDGRSEINFFLFRFEQACTEADTCTNADLYSERLESNWTGLTLYSEEDLKNTPLDCLQCHQSGTPQIAAPRKSLLFHEIEEPWPHFIQTLHLDLTDPPPITGDFDSELPNKRAFVDAHGFDGLFAGLPVNAIVSNSQPQLIQAFMHNNGFGDGFDPSTQTGGDVFGASRLRRYSYDELEAFNLAGQIIQFPTLRSGDLMDPAKVEAATLSLADFRAGERDDVANLSDVFPSGQEADYERLSLGVKAGITGAEIVAQACTQCHNPRLDQSISRARFDATLIDEMETDELVKAEARITLDVEDPGRMPPPRFRVLSDDERERAVDYLQTIIDGR